MSASSSEQRRSRHRRPRRSGVPVEINTLPKIPPRSPVSHASNKKQDKKVLDASLWDSRTRHRVSILPGSLLMPHGEPWSHPAAPREPAPLPTEMLQFLLIGQHQSGKTSMTERFLRRYCVHTLEKPARKWEHPSEWSVEYHKKDITFWHSNDSVGSARVQLWDVTGGGPSDKPLQRRQEWIRLAQKMSGILLVLSLEHGSDVLLETIVGWKQWLDDCCPSLSPVYLFLQKCDLLPNVDPVVWMHLGSRISNICNEIGITDWRLSTCCADKADESSLLPENAIMELVRIITITEASQRSDIRKASLALPYVEQSRAKSGRKFVTDSVQTVLEAEALPIA